MQETPSINAIKNLINQLETERLKVVPEEEGRYGGEEEYTHQALLDELASILDDLRTLTESPKQFLSLSTFDDLNSIRSALGNAMAVFSSPDELLNYIDQIKTTIRPFNIRYTEARFLTTKNQLAELEGQKITSQQTLHDMQRDIKTVQQNISESEKILQSSQKQQQDLTEKLANTKSQVQESENHASKISEFKNTVDSYKPVVDAFTQKIADRERQLQYQESKTNEYNERLIRSLKKAEDLIEKAKTALGYQQAVGISTAFKTRLDRLEDVKWWKSENTAWLFLAIAFSGIAIYLGYELIELIKSSDGNTDKWGLLIVRVSVMTLPIAAVWFCAGQYTKNKNVAEDYAYKTVLAQSIIGFSEQLKNDDKTDSSYLDYVKKMLDEIHQHPLKNHKKHSTSDYSLLKSWRRSKEDKSVDE